MGTVLTLYLSLNLLLTVGFTVLVVSLFLAKKMGLAKSSEAELKLHYFVITLILIAGALSVEMRPNHYVKPLAKVWASPSAAGFNQSYSTKENRGYFLLASSKPVSYSRLGWIVAVLLVVLVVVYFVWDVLRLFKMGSRFFPFRKVGRVIIGVSDNAPVPYSFWVPFRACVVIPSHIVSQPQDLKMVISHELQHHRQKDTKWIYLYRALQWLFIFNPAIHLWNRLLSELQEFACDEALIGQNKVSSQAYARCLIETAENQLNRGSLPACATGLTFLFRPKFLKRRIEKMKQLSHKQKRSVNLFCAVLVSICLGVTAVASKAVIQDRRVSFSQAEEMAKRANGDSEFPVVINDRVLKQLNRYLGTPEGREFMKASLQRMENYRSLISQKLKEYSVPSELMAIPIVESGYQNKPSNPKKPTHGAGIWMFMARTAANFGLNVWGDGGDERLNVAVLTDAAMRLLLADKLRFKDWQLSVLAYNMGENRLQDAISSTGYHDAWKIIEAGYENDKDYLAELMAAILIMKNPSALD